MFLCCEMRRSMSNASSRAFRRARRCSGVDAAESARSTTRNTSSGAFAVALARAGRVVADRVVVNDGPVDEVVAGIADVLIHDFGRATRRPT
jgi:hypothetical protein